MHFVRIFLLALIYNFVMVVAQENSAADSKITDAVDLADLKVAEVSTVTESSDKVSSTEVPLVISLSSNKTSTQATMTNYTKSPSDVQNESVKNSSCILLDLDGLLLFKVPRKNDLWAEYGFNSTATVFRGCHYYEDFKQPRIVGLMGSSFSLNLTAKQRTDESRWYIGTITVAYNPAEVFKDTTFGQYEVIKTSSDEYFMETPMDKSFTCSEPRTIELFNSRDKLAARMVLKSVQIQVYNVPKDDKFSPEFRCGESLAQPVPTDMQDSAYRSDTVPIVVGSCLAVITILIIAGYAAYRSLTVKKLDYATIEE